MMSNVALICCCAPSLSQGQGGHTETLHHVDPSGEIAEIREGGPNQQMAGVLHNSAAPNFPSPARPPQRMDGSSPGTASTQRATPTGNFVSPRDKDQEKVRLQEIVKDFSKAAVAGILVNVIDPDTTEVTPRVFSMDKYLYTLRLKPHGSESEGDEFNMKDLSAIYKGQDIADKAPRLEPVSSCTMGVDLAAPSAADVSPQPPQRVFLHFKDQTERDKFYTCLKILRMSVDIYQQKK